MLLYFNIKRNIKIKIITDISFRINQYECHEKLIN